MNIRPAVAADRTQIEALAQVLMPTTGTLHEPDDRFHLLIRSDDHRVWVADSGKGIVGYLHACLAVRVGVAPFIEIVGLIVDEHSRRRGAGERLVAEAIGWAESTGLAVRVRCNSKRSASHAFYNAQGFELLKQQHVFERQS